MSSSRGTRSTLRTDIACPESRPENQMMLFSRSDSRQYQQLTVFFAETVMAESIPPSRQSTSGLRISWRRGGQPSYRGQTVCMRKPPRRQFR